MSALAVTPAPQPEKLRLMTPAYAADRYLGELTRQGKAATTLHRYQTYLHELADMYPHVDVEDLTPEMWRKWLDRICVGKNGRHLDRDTISQRVAIAKRFSSWLRQEEIIEKDPLERVQPPKRKNPVENDQVVWVSDTEARRMLAVAEADIQLKRDPADKYRKMLCLGVLSYTGGRRGAVSELRIGDYDALGDPYPTLTFREKGGKIIKKPVPTKLADLIREASLAGVWGDPGDYLIPGLSAARTPNRDARIIYRLVKEIAADAKVEAHVHAMRAAFACFFDEQNPGQVLALKDLLGHSSLETTLIYLRRRNRQKGMATVVNLDWGSGGSIPPSVARVERPEDGGPGASDQRQRANLFHASAVAEKEGFEPSFPTNPRQRGDGLPRGAGE